MRARATSHPPAKIHVLSAHPTNLRTKMMLQRRVESMMTLHMEGGSTLTVRSYIRDSSSNRMRNSRRVERGLEGIWNGTEVEKGPGQ